MGIYPARKQWFVVFLVFLLSFVILLSQLSKYDLRGHKWVYMYIMDLPERYQTVHKLQETVRHAWQPGAQYALLDVKEPYLKSYRGGKIIETQGHYQILHYNEEFNMAAEVDNKIITETCAYQNCYFTNNRTQYQSSSALLFALSHGKTRIGPQAPPKLPGQVWIFWDRESPVISSKFFYRHESWKNVMNWSMTNRFDSDIVWPYGTLSSRDPSKIPIKDYSATFKQKTKFIFWLASNCDGMVFSARNEFVEELKKYVPVDGYGACAGKRLNDNEVKDLFKQYKFYLSLENSMCHWYVTEKFFNRYSEDSVLITRGGAEYDQLFPSGTFINSANFMNPASLAQHLLRINASEKMYTDILRNKDKYVAGDNLNWQCQMCAMLNNQNQHRRVYENIVSFWHVDMCWRAQDVFLNRSNTYIVVILIFLILVTFLSFRFRFKRNNQRFIDAVQIFYGSKR